jgi:Leucine-rich repeat (LRR) protein
MIGLRFPDPPDEKSVEHNHAQLQKKSQALTIMLVLVNRSSELQSFPLSWDHTLELRGLVTGTLRLS